MPKWSTEMDDVLKAYVADSKLAASGMADVLRKEFSETFSRNSVIGRMHRLGLCSLRKVSQNTIHRESAPRPIRIYRMVKRALAKERDNVVPLIPVESEPIILDDSAPRTDLLTLFDLGLTSCRWPYGNGTSDDPFLFCGRTVCDGDSKNSYCRGHAKIAFVKPQPRVRHPFRRAA